MALKSLRCPPKVGTFHRITNKGIDSFYKFLYTINAKQGVLQETTILLNDKCLPLWADGGEYPINHSVTCPEL